MKWLTVDFDKGKDHSPSKEWDTSDNKIGEEKDRIKYCKEDTSDEHDQKLSHREWSEDFVFDVDKLWHYKPLRHMDVV